MNYTNYIMSWQNDAKLLYALIFLIILQVHLVTKSTFMKLLDIFYEIATYHLRCIYLFYFL